MRYLISYDISDDKIRSRISRLLEAYGSRVQRSVFECVLAPNEFEALARRLQRSLGSAEKLAF